MGLLKRRKQKKVLPRRYSFLRCPHEGHQVSWCRGLCTPLPNGFGICGRVAPHTAMGKTQRAIAAAAERRAKG